MYSGSVKVVCEYFRCVVDVLWGFKKRLRVFATVVDVLWEC